MKDYPVYARLVAWFDGKSDYITSQEVRAFISAEKADPEHRAELEAFADILVYNALMQRAVTQRATVKNSNRRALERAQIRPRILQAAEKLSEGKPAGIFYDRYKVDEKGTIRTAAEMDGPAHLFVAAQCAHNSKRAGLFAAFHKAVGKKCGLKRTDEVYTPEQYESLYLSIVSRPDAA